MWKTWQVEAQMPIDAIQLFWAYGANPSTFVELASGAEISDLLIVGITRADLGISVKRERKRWIQDSWFW